MSIQNRRISTVLLRTCKTIQPWSQAISADRGTVPLSAHLQGLPLGQKGGEDVGVGVDADGGGTRKVVVIAGDGKPLAIFLWSI